MSTTNTHESHAYEYYTLVPDSDTRGSESKFRFACSPNYLFFIGPQTNPRISTSSDSNTAPANINLSIRIPQGLGQNEKESLFQQLCDEISNSLTCDTMSAMNTWREGFKYKTDTQNPSYPSEQHTCNEINTQLTNTGIHHCYECGSRRETDELYIFRVIKDEHGNEIVVRICVVEHELNRLDNKPLAYSTSIGKPAIAILSLNIHIDVETVPAWDCIQQAILEDQNTTEADTPST